VSCKKAQEFLDAENAEFVAVVDARKVKIGNETAWDRLKGFKHIIIGKGKKIIEIEPCEKNKDDVLKNALGRTGNLRAPAIDMGDRIIVGFNDQMYNDFIKG